MQVVNRLGKPSSNLAQTVYHLTKQVRVEKLTEQHPEVEHRLGVLRRYGEARAQGLKAPTAANVVGVPYRTIQRWIRALNGNAANLVARKRGPRKARKPVKHTDVLVRQVAELRDEHAWGKNKIAAFLRQRGTDVSATTIGRVLARLLRDREVDPIRAGKRNAPRAKPRKRPWARRAKPAEPRKPMDLLQADTLFVRVSKNRCLAVIFAIDVLTRRVWMTVAERATAAAATGLLDEVCRDGTPAAIQVDGGAEFQAEFEDACAERGIALHVLPPRSPKLNAIIESFNGTFRRECLNRLDEPPADVATLEKVARAFLRVYHHVRPHQALGWRTPAQCHPW